jgi:hypothetical protein
MPKSVSIVQFRAVVFCLTFVAIASGLPMQAGHTADTSTATILTPNYRDSEIPQIQTLATSVSKTNDQLTVAAELNVKIKSNTLSSIELNLSPRTTNQAVNPKLIPPCVKLGSIKAQSATVGGEMGALQSRVKTSDGWYLERYVVTLISKLPLVLYPTAVPTYQDLCDGQYLISSIVLKDAAGHILTITANASSTAPIVTATSNQTTSNSTVASNKFLDTPIMQADFWIEGYPMPCVPTTNLAPVTTTTTVNGKSTTTSVAPKTSSTIRTACNQGVDFTKVYINASGSTNGGIGSSPLPVVDYASQAKGALQENLQLKKTVDSLQQRLSNFESGKKPTVDTSTASVALPIIDYKAKADALQKQIDSLNAQLKKFGVTPKATTQSSAAPKVSPLSSTTPKAYPSYSPRNRHAATSKPTPKATKSPVKK